MTVLSINTAAHRVCKSGQDPTGLGRWCWTKYGGKHGVSVMVICAYRQCNPHDPGENTVHYQHQQFYNNHGDARIPRQAILEDLGAHIQTAITEGDQIVLLMDCNEDV